MKANLCRNHRPHGDHWTLHFMEGVLCDGRPFRSLAVVNEARSEVLAIEVDRTFSAARLCQTFDRVAAAHGLPQCIWMDRGREMMSRSIADWGCAKGVALHYQSLGGPGGRARAERLEYGYRDSVLKPNMFSSLAHVQRISERWLHDVNSLRHRGVLQSGTHPKPFPSSGLPLATLLNERSVRSGRTRDERLLTAEPASRAEIPSLSTELKVRSEIDSTTMDLMRMPQPATGSQRQRSMRSRDSDPRLPVEVPSRGHKKV